MSYIDRSMPPGWRLRLGMLFPITGFIAYVAYMDYRWFSTENLPLFIFYVVVACGTLLILLSGMIWRSFTHLDPAPGRVIAIIPIYNEDPELYTAAVWSLINQTRPPDVIHVVDDGSKMPLVTFEHPLVVWHHQVNQGKRHAQANVLSKYSPNSWDYVFTVDSDSVCDPDALEHLLRSMSNPKVQAATGMIFVRNWKDNFLTRLTDINVVSSCLMFRMFRSHLGVVTPTSGAIALYRAWVLYDNLDDYVTSGTYGDDRRLSFYALMKGEVVGVHEAVVETALPDKWNKIFWQRLRWSLSAWKGTPFVLTNMRPLVIFLYMYPLAFALMWPVVVTVLSILWYKYNNPVIWYGLGFVVVTSICMTAIYSMYRPTLTRRQRLGQFMLAPLYPILGLVILRPAAYWALTKLRSTSWFTRETDSEDTIELDELLNSDETKRGLAPWQRPVS